MESTPVAPVPAPAKKSNVGMIVAVIVVAILSLCCCVSGLPIFLGAGTYNGVLGNSSTSGSIPAAYGLICICAAIIPWIVLGIIVLIRRPKKQQ